MKALSLHRLVFLLLGTARAIAKRYVRIVFGWADERIQPGNNLQRFYRLLPSDDHFRLPHAFLWENGSLIDISDQVLPGSGFVSVFLVVINDMGEIAAIGTLANGDVHAVILEPDGSAATPSQAEMTASHSHAATATQR